VCESFQWLLYCDPSRRRHRSAHSEVGVNRDVLGSVSASPADTRAPLSVCSSPTRVRRAITVSHAADGYRVPVVETSINSREFETLEEHSGREDGQYREPLVEEAAFCRRSEQHGANRADREPDGSENSEPRAADIRRGRERSNDGSRTVAKPSRVLTSAVTATRPQSPSTNGNMTRAIVGPLATITSDRRMPNRSYATPESGLMQMPSAKNVPKGDWRRSPKALSPRSDTSGRSS